MQFGGTTSVSLLEKAKQMDGTRSAKLKGTNGGRLACAAMVVKVADEAGIEVPRTYSTRDMFYKLKEDPYWRQVRQPTPGAIVISPTGYSRKRGHVGIIDEDGRIWSNNSSHKRWDDHYDLPAWKNRWGNNTYYFVPTI
jgi:hypothetical protein